MGSCFIARGRNTFRSYLRSAGCHRQSGGLLDVHCGVDVPVMGRTARSAHPVPDIEGFGAVFHPAGRAHPTGRLEPP